eukprot:5625998-Amphidinium_carterae.1
MSAWQPCSSWSWGWGNREHPVRNHDTDTHGRWSVYVGDVAFSQAGFQPVRPRPLEAMQQRGGRDGHVCASGAEGESFAEEVADQSGSAMDDEWDEETTERGEETVDVESRRVPRAPTAEEVRVHRLTHCPFRTWCPVCVAARGRDPPHRRRKRWSRGGSCDSGGDARGGDKGGSCSRGASERGCGMDNKQLHRDLLKWGIRGDVTLKGDQEEAMKSLLEGLARRRAESEPASRTVIEHSPVRDSSGNGIAEAGVRGIEEMCRCIKLGLEERLKHGVSVKHKVFPWIVEHAADVLTKYVIGKDGMSAYRRLKGKNYRGVVYEFGQRVLYRISGKPQGSSMMPRWLSGIWLGKRFASDENILATERGHVVRARGVRSISQDHLYDETLLEKVVGVPWNTDGQGEEEEEAVRVLPLPLPELPPQAESEWNRAPKAPRIRREHLVRLGYTPTCPKCRAIARNDRTQPTLAHTPQCRKRVYEDLQSDPEFSKELKAAEERKRVWREEREKESEKVPVQPIPGSADGRSQAEKRDREEDMREFIDDECRVLWAQLQSMDPSVVMNDYLVGGKWDHFALADDIRVTRRRLEEAGKLEPESMAESHARSSTDEMPSTERMTRAAEGPLDETERPNAYRRVEDEEGTEEGEMEVKQASEGEADASGELPVPPAEAPGNEAMVQMMCACAASSETAAQVLGVGGVADDCMHEEEDLEWQRVSLPSGGGEEVSVDPALVQAARKEELTIFAEMNVYERIEKKSVQWTPETVFVGTRWVDTNKGTKSCPEIRSRLVAQEFAHTKRDDLYAGTPPLVMFRILCHLLSGAEQKWRALVLDVKRAFLYGKTARRIIIRLPAEDPLHETHYGMLVKAMYGTRDAPKVWQQEVREKMQIVGFTASKVVPCLYYDAGRRVWAIAHVDDFFVIGEKGALERVHLELSRHFLLKRKYLGPDSGEEKQVDFLGRSVRWTDVGIEVSGNGAHIQTLLKLWQMEDCNSVTSPGCNDSSTEGTVSEKLLGERLKRYRGGAALLNYIAQDRLDLSFAAKEAARAMACPTEADEVRVKRAIRFLKGHPRLVSLYRWGQGEDAVLKGYTDSDWGGCRRTRRSTSGGVLMWGSSCISHWSRTQANVALSSGEAELNGVLQCLCEVICLRNLMHEYSLELSIEILTDSAAAHGASMRHGVGRMKHLHLKQLFVQEALEKYGIKVKRIPRKENVADVLTHHWTRKEVQTVLRQCSLSWEQGLSAKENPCHQLEC